MREGNGEEFLQLLLYESVTKMPLKHAQPVELQIDFKFFICKIVVALTKHLHKIHRFKTSNDRKCNVICSQIGCTDMFNIFG